MKTKFRSVFEEQWLMISLRLLECSLIALHVVVVDAVHQASIWGHGFVCISLLFSLGKVQSTNYLMDIKWTAPKPWKKVYIRTVTCLTWYYRSWTVTLYLWYEHFQFTLLNCPTSPKCTRLHPSKMSLSVRLQCVSCLILLLIQPSAQSPTGATG